MAPLTPHRYPSRKRISNPIKQLRKLRLRLNCLLKVTQQVKSGAGIKTRAEEFSLYPAVTRCRQFCSPRGLGQTSDTGQEDLGAGSSAIRQKEVRRKDLEAWLKVQTIHSNSSLWLSNTSPNPLHVTLSTLQLPTIPVAPTGSGQDTAFHQIKGPQGAPASSAGLKDHHTTPLCVLSPHKSPPKLQVG